MRHADMAGLHGVGEYMMTAAHTAQCPAIRFELFDDLLAVHGSYYNHSQWKINTITTNRSAIRWFGKAAAKSVGIGGGQVEL